MNKHERWLTLLDHARSAVPVLMLSGLAGFTWWLVQSAPSLDGARPAAKASSSPDYELRKARIERYNPEGRLIAILDGETMRHYADGDRIEVDAVQLSARDPKGQLVQGVARLGEANGTQETVVLRGGARVVATPASGAVVNGSRVDQSPVVFEGEVLRFDTRGRVVSSELPVKITHAQAQVQGGNLRYDDNTRTVQLGQRVHGRYEAPARR
ncbi:LPS export ABC transporter periplasmic protein LptC [Aquabacterium sp.]|uniref:LPS export ABC transporter periplasmic protein LptC n=1 Tax=Aquabacterium sp. TaxID=1872578 RepID=UPI003D6D5428